MDDHYIFRKVRPAEARQFLRLRLQALKTDPEAFASTLEEEQRRSHKDVENYLMKNYVLGAFGKNKELVGTLVYMEQERQKFRHIGILGGMYVQPGHRRLGIGKKLLVLMLKNLEKFGHLYALQLKVITANAPAIRLYRSLGFSIWATEKNALFHDGIFFDQHHMTFQFGASCSMALLKHQNLVKY